MWTGVERRHTEVFGTRAMEENGEEKKKQEESDDRVMKGAGSKSDFVSLFVSFPCCCCFLFGVSRVLGKSKWAEAVLKSRIVSSLLVFKSQDNTIVQHDCP